jgi:hypothetical protein
MITNHARCPCESKSTTVMGKQHSIAEDSFHKQTGLRFKEENSKVVNLEHSTVWCSILDTADGTPEISTTFQKHGIGEGWRSSGSFV